MQVREARPDERDAALNVLDAAMLETDRVDEGTLLVAVDRGSVVGALLLVGDRIDAVAVRRRRQGKGVGSALVAAAGERRERLVAAFDAGVRPFYESLGFDVRETDEPGRYRGVLEG
ncbi:GNAT family N-acetyltransferase [Salinirubellus salinus]|uniref:GNAT family N-acetyltransferase n=1 Tax=Salinirubellus salinus TaxID=1364945 RepID=A0A9E7UAS2_9EURY|nr:GNAT family N-acetyltransferase [Salinirubellus salinus]UWM54094.1 GNAT family N-acetyltransferase [Salinirubellus salinus]